MLLCANTCAIKTSRRGRAKKSRSSSRLFFPPFDSLSLSNSTHARTHVRYATHESVQNIRESVGRDLLAWIECALDRRPPRESSFAVTKRERTRPLVFIRVPHCPPRHDRLSLSRRIPHPKSREDTHEILILVSGSEETCTRSRPLVRIL